MSRKREPVPGWVITDHVCRICFSRILMQEADDKSKTYHCSGCGVEAKGRAPSVLCCCGIKLKTGVDAGTRCDKNPARSPEFPCEITAIQVGRDKPN